MSAPEDTFPVLNPDTPLAFLSPAAATQTNVSTYIVAITVGVCESCPILSDYTF